MSNQLDPVPSAGEHASATRDPNHIALARSNTSTRRVDYLPITVVGFFAALLLVILFYVSDQILTEATIAAVNSDFDKDKFGQTVGQLTASIADTNLHILLGLFIIVGFSLAFDASYTRSKFRYLVTPLCIFGTSAVLTVYFAIRWKLGLLEQVQFGQVHIDRIEMAFRCHMYAFLGAVLSCFAIVLMVLSAPAKAKAKDDEK